MDNKIRICAVCRNSYSYCPHCGEDKLKPTWYFSFCGENCKNIYDVTSKYENGQIDANGANVKLNELDLSKLDKFGTSYKTSIERITSTTAVVEIAVEEVVDAIVETKDEEIVETVETPLMIETVEEEKIIRKSKRAKRNVE